MLKNTNAICLISLNLKNIFFAVNFLTANCFVVSFLTAYLIADTADLTADSTAEPADLIPGEFILII